MADWIVVYCPPPPTMRTAASLKMTCSTLVIVSTTGPMLRTSPVWVKEVMV